MKINRIKLVNRIIFIISLLSGIYFVTLNITGLTLNYFPGHLGDGRLNLYFLEHCYRFFTGKITSFWSAPFMYPEPRIITYSDNLLGSAPIYAIFRIFNLDVYHAYQLWFITVTALNFITAFLFLKAVSKNYLAAILGAFVFAFSLSLQSQITHAQTFPRFAIPLAFLMAYRFEDALHPKYFFGTLFFVVYQIYCGMYLGFMLIIPIGIYLIIIFISKWEFFKKQFISYKWPLLMLSSLLVNGIILLPLILPYLDHRAGISWQQYLEILPTVPALKSFFYSHHGSLFWDFIDETANDYTAWWDHQIFTGGLATICFICFTGIYLFKIIKNKKIEFGEVKFITIIIAGLLTMILYLRFGNISAYLFVYIIPGFGFMRSITRIINIELIFFALSVSLIFSGFIKQNNWKSYIFFIIILTVLIADNYCKEGKSYRTSVGRAEQRVNPLIDTYKNFPKGSVVSYEPENIDTASHYLLDAMLASQVCDMYSINGYTATSPNGYNNYWHNMDEISRNFWLSIKQKCFDTLYVVKSPGNYYKVTWEEAIGNKSQDEINQEIMQRQIEYIRSDEKWMNKIIEKAKDKNIPVDSMLYLDAKWILDHKN